MGLQEMVSRFIAQSATHNFREVFNKSFNDKDTEKIAGGLEVMDVYNKNVSIISTGAYSISNMKADIIKRKYE